VRIGIKASVASLTQPVDASFRHFVAQHMPNHRFGRARLHTRKQGMGRQPQLSIDA